MESETAQSILDSISEVSPTHAEYLKEWEDKTPQESVAAARKAFYGIVEPELVAGQQLSPEQLGELEAIFEGCFKKVEQSSMQRGRRTSSVGSP